MQESELPIWLLLFSASFCCVSSDVAVQKTTLENSKVVVNIGLIYEEGNMIEKMALNCIEWGLSEFYNSHAHYNTRISLKTKVYSKDNAISAAAAALYLLKFDEVKVIMGSIATMDSEFVINLGEEAKVPVLSYSITSPFLSSVQGSYFVRATPNNLPHAKAICAVVKAYGWKQIIPIYTDNDYETTFVSHLGEFLTQTDVRIPYHGVLPKFATDQQIHELLYTLKSKSIRVFVVHVSADVASRLFLNARELEMMEEGYVWITTAGINNELGSLNHTVIESMQGVIGLKAYVPQTDKLREFEMKWDQEFQGIKLSVTGLWAHDAACALARAVEVVANPNSGFQKRNVYKNNYTDLDTLGVSSVGSTLLQSLLNTSFNGLAGEFSLPDRQLETSTYKIINVIGSGSRDIGFWTPEKGLIRNMNSSNSNLKAIMWPGDIILVPKGWEIVPTRANKLMKVGVPVKGFYEELVKVTQDKRTGTLNVAGFCIEVFETVMKNLQYSGLYEYTSFPAVAPTDSYDDLIYQLYLQRFDIVVGDVTITANRSLYVDFTLPYTDSGVTMVVPVKEEKRSAWVFLTPLTTELWVAILSAFIFIAFAIWVLEHRTNDEFRGPPSQQAGTSLFYSFSILVFAQRENVYSNLARFVVIIWIFVVFVLTQSYTASLTSMLTVQQLQPSVTDVNKLISSGAKVGYQEGSFVKGLLKQKGFHESKLVPYNTKEQLDMILTDGNQNGGIAAVFDEIPYMKIFLTKYSSKYIMVQPLYKAEGFGFAFPKGSPLVSEVSRELLNVIEGDGMLRMEKKWGMPLFNSSDDGNKVASSGRLSLDSFWGLFLIAGVASGLSLLIFTAKFLYEHRHIWLYSDTSIRRKAQHLSQAFLQRDMSSHTSKTHKSQHPRSLESDQKSDLGGEVENIALARRPSTYSDQTEEDLVLSAGTATPSDDLVIMPPGSLATEVLGHVSNEQND